MMTWETRTQFRGGEWWESTGENPTTTINPANGKVLATYRQASADDLNLALESLRASFPQWKSAGLMERQQSLGRIAEEVQRDRETIARQMTLEMGKTLRESRIEVDTFVNTCRWFQHEAGRARGKVIPSADGTRMIHTRVKPIGIVFCVTPWNFPILLAGYKIFAALAIGNVVLWKPAQQVNGTATLVVEAFRRAGVGAEFCLLGAASGELASVGVADSRVDAVSFTGSTAVGQQISQKVAPALKPCSLELGGKNAAIVLADADLEYAATEIVRCAFLTSGQRCSATSRIIVQDCVADQLIEAVLKRMAALRIGDGLDAKSDLGPLATEAQRENVEQAVAEAVASGARVRHGGNRPADRLSEGFYYMPTLLDMVTPDMKVAREEIFGPVVATLRVSSAAEAYQVGNSTPYGLSTSVFTRSLSEAHHAMDVVDSGVIYINRGTSSAELGVPFGGTGMSGNGHREVSADGFDFMSEIVSIYVDPRVGSRDD